MVELELGALIDEALTLAPDVFRGPHFGSYELWRRRCVEFLERVFGTVERQRFLEPYPTTPDSLARNLEDQIRLMVNEEGLRQAAGYRRRESPADRIVRADG